MLPKLRQRVAHRLAPEIAEQFTEKITQVTEQFTEEIGQVTDQLTEITTELAAIKAKPITHDNIGWLALAIEGTQDRPYAEWEKDVADALEAWQKNFLARQIVRLTTNYVIGDTIDIGSRIKGVDDFIKEWWNHDMNHMDRRLSGMCDELTRAGELFPVLFPHPVSPVGSYIRFIPARFIDRIDTAAGDLENELRYHRVPTLKLVRGRWYYAPHKAKLGKPRMLHFAVNRPIGATRGEGDLVPILAWIRRYTKWLIGRCKLNEARSKSGLWDVTITDPTLLDEKKKEYKTKIPTHGSIAVHGPEEVWLPMNLNIAAHSARDDGKAIRLAVATGSGQPLHFFGEGESATQATATEMNAPTFRHFRQRQLDFILCLKGIITAAYNLSDEPPFDDLQLTSITPDIETRDNKLLADSALTIVKALAIMKGEGWITNELAIELALKFAGEIVSKDQIDLIMKSFATEVNGA